MNQITEQVLQKVGRIGFIGAGKAGFTLGKYFAEHGVLLSGYASQHFQSAKEAAEFTNSKAYKDENELLLSSDTLFLTVPDGQIKDVWDYMRTLPAGLADKTVCHVSGSLSSSIFSGMERTGAVGFSVHPLFAISDRQSSYKELFKCVFTIEGKEHPKRQALYELLTGCGNAVEFITEENKALYHAAAVIASNFVVGLSYLGSQMLQECGFSEETAQKALSPLLLGNVENICRQGTVEALTGPVERNDAKTVLRHLSAFAEHSKTVGQQEDWNGHLVEDVYRDMTKVLVKIAQEKHQNMDYGKLKEILEK